MYNYYLDLKRKKQIEEVKKNEEKKKILKKKHDKKLLEYTKNYENRIKNFIYQMAEKPILLKEQKELFSTTREKLLNEESDKILFNKGFVFHFNRAERDKGTFYRKETEGLNEYIKKETFKKKKNPFLTNSESNNIISLKHNFQTKESTKNFFHKNPYSQSSESLSYSNYNNTIKDKINKNSKSFKLTQPEMRFKPRSDLERVFLAMSENDLNYANKASKKVIQTQLSKMGFNPLINYNFNSKDTINDFSERNNEKSIEELLRENENKNKGNNKININILRKKIDLKKPDNSKAKILHLDLYNKTYFNAIENYSLFKTSCFLPNKFSTQENKSVKNIDNRKTKINFDKQKLYLSKTNSFNKFNIKNSKNDLFLDDENYKENITHINSTNDLISMLNNSKLNNSIEDKILNSLKSVDLFTNNFKEQKKKLTKNEKINFDIIRSLAFGKKNNNYNSQVYNIKKDDKNNFDRKNSIEKANSNLSSTFGFLIGDNEEIGIKKPEEKIIVDGIEYSKNDMESLSKVVMKKCNFFRKKYGQ